jgi:hypothetical protein
MATGDWVALTGVVLSQRTETTNEKGKRMIHIKSRLARCDPQLTGENSELPYAQMQRKRKLLN